MLISWGYKIGIRLGMILILGVLFYWMLLSEVLAAGSLSLSPTTETGSSFNVQVILDTGTDASNETDLLINFDPNILQVSNVTFGQLYPENVQNIDNSSGKLSTFSYFSSTGPGDNFSGIGTLATIQFTGITEGVSAVTISCTPSVTNDSNIIKQGVAQDILDCLSVVNGSYTVDTVVQTVTPSSYPTPTTTTLEVSPTSTPTPTPTTAPTLTPVPTREIGTSSYTTPTPTPVGQLMESGSITTTLTLSIIGAVLLMGSVILFIW